MIVPGVEGTEFTVTAKVAEEELPQVLLAMIETVPPPEPAVVLILLVVDVPVHPPGSDHVYEVAPFTAAMENVSKPPLQTEIRPVIVPGVVGAELTVTGSIAAEELPQELLAVTETVPPPEPAVPNMVLVVDEPVQPTGRDHVYEVAPLTDVIENVSKPPVHIGVRPEIVPGVEGTDFIVTTRVTTLSQL